jgi:membrane protein DedA with SNARE-associated domain
MVLTGNSYLDVFLALLLSTTFVPVPEELPVIAAGVVCGHSDTTYADDRGNPARVLWWVMLPVVIVGAVIGDIVLYTIGRLWGRRLLDLKWVQRRVVTPEKRASIERNFAKHGIKVLLGVRLLPGVRGPVFFIAGMVRLPLWKFVLADAIYAIPIVNLMFWTAYWFTDQIMVLVNNLDTYKSLVMSHVLAAVAGALVYKYLLSRHVPTGEPAPIVEKAGKIGHAIESAFESVADAVTGRHHHEPDGAEKKPGEGKPKEADHATSPHSETPHDPRPPAK